MDELSKINFTDGRELDPEFIKVVKASLTENQAKEVEEILERISGANKLGLQTNELVLPAKDVAQSGMFEGKVPEVNEKEWMNRLI